jgi:peroxiredoxin
MRHNIVNPSFKMSIMSKLIQNSILLLAFLAFTFTLSGQRSIPDIDVMTLAGDKVNLADHANNGKISILSFWATWCSPCKKELDAISDIYEEWQEEYDVELIAISVDNSRSMAKVGPMVEQKGWDYIIYLDPNQDLQKSLNFRVVPQTFVLDKEGNIAYSHTGYVPGDEYELEEKIAELSK